MKALAAAIGLVLAGSATAQSQPGSLILFFDWGKPDIRSDDRAVLDRAAAMWRANPDARLMLSGHSDRSGSAAANIRASRIRAQMVRNELVERGVRASAISLAAFGEQRPLVPTEDGVREVQNRRVEITLDGEVSTSVMPVPFQILGPNGEPRGFASFVNDGHRTTIKVEASNLAPGVHGIHLHAVGSCEGPDFKSAGPHWNPTGKRHGHDNPAGPHLGDLPNITVGADGKGNASFAIDGDMADADGTALLIHAEPDDYRTDPSGNSGARVACAVLTTPR